MQKLVIGAIVKTNNKKTPSEPFFGNYNKSKGQPLLTFEVTPE